jgi:hypothetical protein
MIKYCIHPGCVHISARDNLRVGGLGLVGTCLQEGPDHRDRYLE